MLNFRCEFRRLRQQSKKAALHLRLSCSWQTSTNLPRPSALATLQLHVMPPPPLSRVVRELSHVSVDYFVPRPGTALRASQNARRTPRPRHARALALAPSPRACESRGARGRGVAILPLAHARRPLAGSAPRLECGDNPNLNPKLNPKT